MANPKKRKNHSAVRKGRAHLALKEVAINKCSKCGQPKKPHTACTFCGSYKGQEVIRIKSRATTK